jgi:DNA-binding transcriptional LysR family regulator
MAEIETRLFEYFVALADERHFGRAAASLKIGPSTLTHQIKRLESLVGVRLVARRGNTHVALTEPGVRFLPRARNVLVEAAEAAAVARQAARGEIGRIEVGFMAIALLTGMIDKLVRAFQQKNPGIEIVLRQMITEQQVGSILDTNLDFGIARMPERFPAGLSGFLVSRQPMILALPSDHPLARNKAIDPAALRNESFISYSPTIDIGYWNHMEVLGSLGKFTPKISKRIGDIMSILSYVSAGQGIALVSQAFSEMNIPNVAYRKIATATPPMLRVALIHRKNEPSPAGQSFLRDMRRHAIR